MLNPIEKGFRNVLSYMQQHWREVRLHCLPARAAVAVSLTPLCAPPSPTRKAEQRPYAVLQRGFASVTPAHARSHFHAMRTAMAAM